MELRKGTIKSSPFVGIFAKATDKFVLVPEQLQKKETVGLEDFFGVEVIRASVANSPLIGVLAVANRHGIILPWLAEEAEAKKLEEAGLRVKRIKNVNALGNFAAVNNHKGVCGKTLSRETKNEMEDFLKIEIKPISVAGSDLVGAMLVANDRGFVLHARAEKKEIAAIEKFFGLRGKATSANYGDAFVAHSIVANSSAALVGLHTTPHELLRIDEGLNGE